MHGLVTHLVDAAHLAQLHRRGAAVVNPLAVWRILGRKHRHEAVLPKDEPDLLRTDLMHPAVRVLWSLGVFVTGGALVVVLGAR
jgi:hypothetical protein